MDRRSFLGSVIGFVASQSFFARLIHEPPQIIPVTDFKMLFHDEISGYTVQAPSIKEIVQNEYGFVFKAHRLKITQAMILTHGLLVNKHNEVLRLMPFDCKWILTNGDTFNYNYAISIERFIRRDSSNPETNFLETLGAYKREALLRNMDPTR